MYSRVSYAHRNNTSSRRGFVYRLLRIYFMFSLRTGAINLRDSSELRVTEEGGTVSFLNNNATAYGGMDFPFCLYY